MKLYNIKKARINKNAKVACDNITDILKIFDLTTRGLKNFKGYTSVQRVLDSIQYEKNLLESHLNEFKKLKDNKDEK